MDQPGSYLVRFSYTGYEEALRYITINDHNENGGFGHYKYEDGGEYARGSHSLWTRIPYAADRRYDTV